jgi:outer membrane protein
MRTPGFLKMHVAIAALSCTAASHAARGDETASAPATAAGAPRVFKLSDAEHLALASQPQLLVARAQTRAAEAGVELTRSPLLPQVTATGQYTRQTGNFVPRPGVIPGTNVTAAASTSLTKSYDFWNVGVTATQLIYDFGQTFEKYRASQATANAERSTERATQFQILVGVRSAYFAARANKDLVAVARETLSAQEKHLGQVQGFVQVGTQPLIALAQQRAAVANAKVQFVNAQNNYETAKAQLNQAVGLQGGTDYDMGDEMLDPVPDEDQSLETLVLKGVAARPEMMSLASAQQAQQATLSAAKGGYGPAFSATAGFTGAGVALDGLVPNWSAALLLTWPIFQGGLTTAQVHQAEAVLSGIDAQKALELLQIQLQIDSARLAVRAAKAAISAAQDATESAHEQLRLAEQRYATGVGSIIELNDAQVTYTAAAAQLVQARYGLASARAQLLAALGRAG